MHAGGSTTSQLVQLSDMATSMAIPLEKPPCSLLEQTLIHAGTLQVHYSVDGPLMHPNTQHSDHLWEGFGHSLQAVAMEFKNIT